MNLREYLTRRYTLLVKKDKDEVYETSRVSSVRNINIFDNCWKSKESWKSNDVRVFLET